MSAHVLSPVVLRDLPGWGPGVIDRIEIVIRDSGLPKALFAARCGISSESLSHLRRNEGRALPSAGTLAAIGLASGVSLDWLVLGRGPMRVGAGAEGCPVCVPRLGEAS